MLGYQFAGGLLNDAGVNLRLPSCHDLLRAFVGRHEPYEAADAPSLMEGMKRVAGGCDPFAKPGPFGHEGAVCERGGQGASCDRGLQGGAHRLTFASAGAHDPFGDPEEEGNARRKVEQWTEARVPEGVQNHCADVTQHGE